MNDIKSTNTNTKVIASEARVKQSDDAIANNKQITSAKKPRNDAPQLRFAEFEGQWIKINLGNLFTFKNGLNSNKDKYGTGVKFINVMDIIDDNVITYDSIIGKVEVSSKELEKNEVIYGDVLFQRSSETREEVGQSNIYVDRSKSAVFGGFVIRGRKKQDYNPYFLNYLLKTSSARKEITTKSGGSTRYNVGQESLSQVLIYLTSLPEQQKIARFLTAVDTKLQQLTQKKALLQQYKKGVMQQLFSQKLRFKPKHKNESSWRGTKPNRTVIASPVARHEANQDDAISSNSTLTNYPNWEEKKLGEVCIVNPRSSSLPDEFIYIDLESVKNGVLKQENKIIKSEAPSRAQRLLLVNDILYQTVRPYQMNNLFFKKNGEYVASTGYAQIRANENPMFLFQLLHSDKFVNDVIKRCTGTSFPAINSNDLARIRIKIPSKEEQQQIASYLAALDTKIETVTQQIEKTQEFKKGLLQQLFV